MDKKQRNIIFSLAIIVIGWLIIGYGYAGEIEQPLNTILFLSGLGFIFFGLLQFIINAKKN